MKEKPVTGDEVYETPSATPNFQTELAAQLADLVPEAITDGKVDVVKLQELLATDAADGTERFGLFWPGKKRALRAAQEPTTATLKPTSSTRKTGTRQRTSSSRATTSKCLRSCRSTTTRRSN